MYILKLTFVIEEILVRIFLFGGEILVSIPRVVLDAFCEGRGRIQEHHQGRR
jgi:hypothetical protein